MIDVVNRYHVAVRSAATAFVATLAIAIASSTAMAQRMLVPMDDGQTNHLLACIAKGFFRCRIKVHNPAQVIHSDNGVECCLKHGSLQGLAFSQCCFDLFAHANFFLGFFVQPSIIQR